MIKKKTIVSRNCSRTLWRQRTHYSNGRNLKSDRCGFLMITDSSSNQLSVMTDRFCCFSDRSKWRLNRELLNAVKSVTNPKQLALTIPRFNGACGSTFLQFHTKNFSSYLFHWSSWYMHTDNIQAIEWLALASVDIGLHNVIYWTNTTNTCIVTQSLDNWYRCRYGYRQMDQG